MVKKSRTRRVVPSRVRWTRDVGEVEVIESSSWVDVPSLVSDHRDLIGRVAGSRNVLVDDLRLQLLLHLPRLLPPVPTAEVLLQEADRLARRIYELTTPVKSWLRAPSQRSYGPRDFSFGPITEQESRLVLERLHYLYSARTSSRHLGLRTRSENQLAALLTLSSLDLPDVARLLPQDVPPSSVLVVSRVYVFPWAPYNTVSYLLGRTSRWLTTEMPRIQALVTYVNPNMGFTGVSYRAANWVPFAHEVGTRYSYVDGWYVTDRALAVRFGTSDPTRLGSLLGSRFQVTRIPLQPLSLYVYFLDKELRRMYNSGFHNVLRRPSWP
jgi:hypothetical protein